MIWWRRKTYRLKHSHHSWFYYINNKAINLNESHLQIDPKLFVWWGEDRVVVDSGTKFTLFASKVYQPAKQNVVWLDLCYSIGDVMMTKNCRAIEFLCQKWSSTCIEPTLIELNKATSFQADEDLQEFCMMIGLADALGWTISYM